MLLSVLVGWCCKISSKWSSRGASSGSLPCHESRHVDITSLSFALWWHATLTKYIELLIYTVCVLYCIIYCMICTWYMMIYHDIYIYIYSRAFSDDITIGTDRFAKQVTITTGVPVDPLPMYLGGVGDWACLGAKCALVINHQSGVLGVNIVNGELANTHHQTWWAGKIMAMFDYWYLDAYGILRSPLSTCFRQTYVFGGSPLPFFWSFPADKIATWPATRPSSF